MKAETVRFGEIEIADEKILVFSEGIPGFEQCHLFALITTPETEPFLWLQSLEQTEVSLPLLNPFRIFPEYAPSVPESSLHEIGNPTDEDILLLTVAVIPKDTEKMTTNLASPLLINAVSNQGRQIILEGNEYQIRQPIFDAVQALLSSTEGGE
jgi:flagellar assembly factor FliW